ncbi:MAG: tRNA (guanosine(37)-N1)-methyltransferase TrmD [Candidatus Muiribacteriota bacterium]|jgi:tRNA (guanine37-N1)-methyltransferase
MNFNFITLFPELIDNFITKGLISKSIKNQSVTVNTVNLRQFGLGNYKQTDDYCYGTGKSLLMRADVLKSAIDSIDSGYKILLSPAGKTFNNKTARKLACKKNITFICGRYEGVDKRALELWVDEEISVGDYVLNGGEVAALAVFESVVRFLPGFTREENIENDSFENLLIESGYYTRPRIIENLEVPDILIKGNHKAIENYFHNESLIKTMKNRKDLFLKYKLSENDINFLSGWINE